jgi:hypothetical protein
MKHIAIRSTSVRKRNRPYTTPGLGDRVHTVLIGLLYSLSHNVPVTLHLTSDKWDKQKPESFKEILSLIPPGLVHIQPHAVSNLPEDKWLSYLSCKGFFCITSLNLSLLSSALYKYTVSSAYFVCWWIKT